MVRISFGDSHGTGIFAELAVRINQMLRNFPSHLLTRYNATEGVPAMQIVLNRFSISVFILLFTIFLLPWACAAPIELGIQGGKLTVNGQARFLIFVSYFDALRASESTLSRDFQYLRAHRVDGLRIFPNWWNWSDMKHFPTDTLMDGRGKLREQQLEKLKSILKQAAEHGLIVDVSFAYETVGGLSDLREDQLGVSQGQLPVNQVHLEDYERGLTEVAIALRAYRHIFFDVQNEYNGRITHLTDDDVRRLCKAIKVADPGRIATASLANEIGPEEVAKRSNEANLDIVAWHESRNPWQFDAMDVLTARAKSATNKPLYFGETAELTDEFTVENFITAVTKTKAAGAAAWTFHTEHGFDLSKAALTDQLSNAEKAFLTALFDRLKRIEWGSFSNATSKRP
jgi:hypothetical protein